MIILENGDKIQGDATSASEVDFTIYGLDNNALANLADGQLPDSKGDLYTANSTDVITTIVLVNTGVAHNHINLYLLPSGGTARRLIAKDLQLESGYALHTDGKECKVVDTNGRIMTVLTGIGTGDMLKSVYDSDDDGLIAIDALDVGIADGKVVQIDSASVADNEYARFTANGLESRTAGEVLTDLLASTLAENDLIQLEELLSADGKYSGYGCNGVYGDTFAYGDLLYLNNDDGRWELADADQETTCSPQLAIALEAGNDGDTKKILLYGYIREDDWDWTTVGAPLFVSTTDGDFQEAAPSGAGDIIRVAGYVKDANSIFFNPSGVWIEHV